jgi:hypothetical protein
MTMTKRRSGCASILGLPDWLLVKRGWPGYWYWPGYGYGGDIGIGLGMDMAGMVKRG